MIKKVTRLSPKPPEPTAENPYAQLDWVWERAGLRYRNKNTRANHHYRLAAYKRFLAEEHGYDERLQEDPRFRLAVHWNHYTLYNAAKYWHSQGLASHTVHNYLHSLRIVLHYAAARELTPATEFLEPEIGPLHRETKIREAYEDAELEVIRKVITEATKYAMRVVAGYNPTGAGEDPRRTADYAYVRPGEGWACWDNMVWYFENVLQCRPFHKIRGNSDSHRQFITAAYSYYGGPNGVWRRLGVAPVIDSSLIFPLAMKLAMETGLNPYAILGLKRDCYRDSHPLTGLPYVRYYKERSTGEKDLHVSFFDDPNQADFHLLPKQSEIIRRTIELILKLTEPLVSEAREEDKGHLLLVQNSRRFPKNARPNPVYVLDRGSLQNTSNKIKGALTKAGHDNIPEYLNLARFRPTVITKMVRDGHDFFRVQLAVGHASARTTYRYLNSLNLAPQAQREVSATLVQIHRNKEEFERDPKPYATAATQHQEGVIYKGVLCDCKNVFDPPDAVRRLPTFREGQACTYWNMCLLCPNVLITRKHLPLFISYAKEIELSVEGNNLSHVPNAPHYQKVAAVLEGIFQEFAEDDITWAKQIAECSDHFIDGVTYRGVGV